MTSSGKRRKYSVISHSQASFLPSSQHSKFAKPIRVKKLVPHAKLPKRATEGAVGFDVYSTHSTTIAPNTTATIHTGLAMSIPKPLYLRIATRSSFAKRGLNVTGGVVDNDYRGEIKVLLHNSSDAPVTIASHDRIAQFIFEVCDTPCMVITNSLDSTTREQGGLAAPTPTKTCASSIESKPKCVPYALQIQDVHYNYTPSIMILIHQLTDAYFQPLNLSPLVEIFDQFSVLF